MTGVCQGQYGVDMAQMPILVWIAGSKVEKQQSVRFDWSDLELRPIRNTLIPSNHALGIIPTLAIFICRQMGDG